MHPLSSFWSVDFEFFPDENLNPVPVCVVFQNIGTEEIEKVWLHGENIKCPYPLDGNNNLVAFYASAEIGCHLSLNWPVPENIIDLFPEYKIRYNGVPGRSFSLLSACSTYGIETIAGAAKERMRDRILQGPPFNEQDKQDILDYCETDVVATTALFKAMYKNLDYERALYRGQYMHAVAKMERAGIPIDTEKFNLFVQHWEQIKERLIQDINKEYDVYEGTTFKAAKFEAYLNKYGIHWPRTEKGNLMMDDETFRDMVKTYPELQQLRDARFILGKLKLIGLTNGADGRNRVMLSAFRTKTGRNAPSNTKFIFGPAAWLRSLIQPKPGKVLAYVDYSQQEFLIAAALSKDEKMKQAYVSGDPYLAFAKQAGAVPEDATKQTHKAQRDLFKQCVLGLQYGMGAETLATRIGKPTAYAAELIRHHKNVYRDFWKWVDKVRASTSLAGKLYTSLGWTYNLPSRDAKQIRTVQNWPMQATGAEILRVASIMLVQEGIKILAPIHDALLIECEEHNADQTIKRTQEIMGDASEAVLGVGYRCKTDVDIIKYPDRYVDPRGIDTWDKILAIVSELEAEKQTQKENVTEVII